MLNLSLFNKSSVTVHAQLSCETDRSGGEGELVFRVNEWQRLEVADRQSVCPGCFYFQHNFAGSLLKQKKKWSLLKTYLYRYWPEPLNIFFYQLAQTHRKISKHVLFIVSPVVPIENSNRSLLRPETSSTFLTVLEAEFVIWTIHYILFCFWYETKIRLPHGFTWKVDNLSSYRLHGLFPLLETRTFSVKGIGL